MSLLLFANNAQTVLAGPIAASSTTCNLAAGTGSEFANPAAGQYFVMTFNDQATGLIREIVWVTARSGDTLTILRAQEGTTALNWLANDVAANWWTAGQAATMIQVAQLQAQATNYGADTGAVNAMVVTLPNPPSSLASIIGAPIRVKVGNTNTGSSTLALNGLAATVITNPDGTNLVASQLVAGHIFEVVYNGTTFDLMTAPYELLKKANTWTQTQTFQAIGATNVTASGNVAATGNVSAAAMSTSTGGMTVADFLNVLSGGANINGTTNILSGNFATQAGNITAGGGFLIATNGARNSGNLNAACILNDFSQSWTAINQGYNQTPDNQAVQMQGGTVPAGPGVVSATITLPKTFSGGISGASVCFGGTAPPALVGSICCAPATNNSVLVTANYPAGAGGPLAVVVTAFGHGPLT